MNSNPNGAMVALTIGVCGIIAFGMGVAVASALAIIHYEGTAALLAIFGIGG